MSTESKDLISLVEKLRQEQEFVLFYKHQIQQRVQKLNACCDNVFHSLWLNHSLTYGLNQVLTHRLQSWEWSLAFENANTVDFIDASKVVRPSVIIERYSRFLNSLLTDPKLLANILLWAESQGLNTSLLVSDLMSVVYGHCVFQHDHVLCLQLLRELLKHHISSCESPRDLFSGVEPVFSSVLAEYCWQLVNFRMYLTEVLQEPLMQVLQCEDYLEYDVNKAGSRFQVITESHNGPLVNSSTFLFSEDLESSCEQLAKLSALFLDNLAQSSRQLPLSLKWLLGSLKSLVHQKWPRISPAEIRRPISDLLFGCILSSAIVNPDHYGVIDPNIVLGPVARYNLSQITTVLQGCAWILDKANSSKYPIHKVVKRLNVKAFTSLVDCVDGGYGEESLDLPSSLPSSLPGLKRSAYLASQSQLDNLIGLTSAMANALTGNEDCSALHSQTCGLLSHILPQMKDQASPSPYTINTASLPKPRLRQSDSADLLSSKSTSKDSKRGVSKRREIGIPGKGQPKTPFYKKRSNSASNIALLGTKGGSTAPVRTRAMTRSASPKPAGVERQVSQNSQSPSHADQASVSAPNFRLPVEVLILPVVELVESSGHGQSYGAIQWDFDLLSEEEFMGQRSHSPVCQTLEVTPSGSQAHSRQTTPTSLPDADFSFTGTIASEELDDRSPLLPREDQIEKFPSVPRRELSRKPPKMEQEEGNMHPAGYPDQLETGLTSQFGNADLQPSRSPGYEAPLTWTRKKSPSSPMGGSISTFTTPELPPSLDRGSSPGGKLKLKPAPLPKPPLLRRASPEAVVSPAFALGEMSSAPATNLTGSLPPKMLLNSKVDAVSSSSGQSYENLFEAAAEPRKKSKGKLRKFRDRFKKRSKSSDKTGDKLDDQLANRSLLPRKPRSQSELVGVRKDSTEVEPEPDLLKRRSKSEMDVVEEELDESLPKNHKKKRRSYTLLTRHITEKYAKRKSEDVQSPESPKKEPSPQKYHNVKSSLPSMNAEKFRQSPYCDQLKYKLRWALQNIHTPLSGSPIYLQLCADEDSMCDSRYQLTTLLQGALQRSKWRHDAMEVALLTETLRMVEPLPNQLVAEVIEGVHAEYMKRADYTAYLVRSHQKFQDAKLQVTAVQTAENRMKQVQEELFVHFVVHQFLESQDLQLKRFEREVGGLDLADEKCSLTETYLEFFAETLQENTSWICWPDLEHVTSCLEDHLFAQVYSHVFHPNGDSDMMRDQIFSTHLASLSGTITPTHKSLQIPPVYHSSCPWEAAQKHLKAVIMYKSPRGKLHCVVQSCKILISLLQYAKCGDPPGADDLFPVLVYILIKANPSSLLSTVQYIKNFAENQLRGEDAYWWAQFSTAIEFTKTLE